MICIDQLTGQKLSSEPLLTLAAFRRAEGRLFFGLLLRPEVSDEGSVVSAAERAAGTGFGGASEDANWMRERWGTVLEIGQDLDTVQRAF